MRVIDLSGEQFGQLTGRCYLATGADPERAEILRVKDSRVRPEMLAYRRRR